eukprot:1622855-Pleurochrysis_carterae.AAC.7
MLMQNAKLPRGRVIDANCHGHVDQIEIVDSYIDRRACAFSFIRGTLESARPQSDAFWRLDCASSGISATFSVVIPYRALHTVLGEDEILSEFTETRNW